VCPTRARPHPGLIPWHWPHSNKRMSPFPHV
jgi:hypothetical protein